MKIENIIDRIINNLLYLLVFLLPIFFLPLTNSQITLNKQLLLVVVCFLVSILWFFKTIKTGKMNLVWNKISSGVLVLFIVLAVSTFFSATKNQSFWGTSVEPDSFLNFILYILIFFLFSNLISKNQVSKIIKVFLLSSGIVSLFFLIQEIFGNIFPWDFAKTNGFNLIGSVQVLGVFLGGAFAILIALVFTNKDKSLLMWIIGSLLFISILLINFWVVWLGLVFSVVFLFWTKLRVLGKNKIKLKDYYLLFAIFAISLMFILIRIPMNDILDLPQEVNLSYKAGLNIATKTLEENAKNFLLGSGPASFVYKYTLYRTSAINLTEFWNIRFIQSSSSIITILGTSGILGFLAILFLMGTFFYEGFIRGFKNKHAIVPLIGGLYFLTLWIFYSINLCLMFAGFLMLGLWVIASKKNKEISLIDPPQKAFFSMLGLIILIVIMTAGFYIYTQKYTGAVYFEKGLNFLEKKELNMAAININKARNMAKTNDRYYRDLSQIFLLRINEVLNDKDLSGKQKQEDLQRNIVNAQKIVQEGININPKNSLNWLNAGRIYENLISLNDTAAQSAVSAYKRAIELDPKNPQIYFNLGRTYMTMVERVQKNFNSLTRRFVDDEEKMEEFQNMHNEIIDFAIENFQETIKLKFNFAQAYNLLGKTYEIIGKNELAIKSYGIFLQLEPENIEIRERLENLTK
ncbi:MAG: tetratricopeptide repeat protein [Patescibacteria group bacterium]